MKIGDRVLVKQIICKKGEDVPTLQKLIGARLGREGVITDDNWDDSLPYHVRFDNPPDPTNALSSFSGEELEFISSPEPGPEDATIYVFIMMEKGRLAECSYYTDRQAAEERFKTWFKSPCPDVDLLLVECFAEDRGGMILNEDYSS